MKMKYKRQYYKFQAEGHIPVESKNYHGNDGNATTTSSGGDVNILAQSAPSSSSDAPTTEGVDARIISQKVSPAPATDDICSKILSSMRSDEDLEMYWDNDIATQEGMLFQEIADDEIVCDFYYEEERELIEDSDAEVNALP